MLKPNPVCVDDFGEEIYECFYTGLLSRISQMRTVGSLIPGAPVVHYMANSAKAWEAARYSFRCFNEAEANCNTCKELVRIPHDKRADGFLLGRCSVNEKLKFHPHDPMHMTCYSARAKA